jgi:hypothetical protein
MSGYVKLQLEKKSGYDSKMNEILGLAIQILPLVTLSLSFTSNLFFIITFPASESS